MKQSQGSQGRAQRPICVILKLVINKNYVFNAFKPKPEDGFK